MRIETLQIPHVLFELASACRLLFKEAGVPLKQNLAFFGPCGVKFEARKSLGAMIVNAHQDIRNYSRPTASDNQPYNQVGVLRHPQGFVEHANVN